MNKNILVSIIMPVHNTAQFLKEAINSIINQSYSNLEIIIIDDGSTDGSELICDDFASRDDRIVVYHQDNRGISVARNVGLNNMSGEIVTFIDSDDVYHPAFIEEMINAMIVQQVDIVICKCVVEHSSRCFVWNERKKKSVPNIRHGIYYREDALRELATGALNPAVWNKMYVSTLWNDIRFPIGCTAEDTDTSFRILDLCNSAYVLEKQLYMHRTRSSSISTTYSKENIDDRILAYTHFDNYIFLNHPYIFGDEHIQAFRKQYLKTLIRCYVYYIHEENATRDENYANRLRDLILQVGCVTKCNGFRTRIAFFLIRKFPNGIKLVCPFYDALKKLRYSLGIHK